MVYCAFRMINRSRILATALLLLVCCDVPSLAKILVKRDGQQRIPDQERFNFFDLELLQLVTAANPGNVLVSPVSVKATLAMILEGAGGRSAEQIRSALRLPENPSAVQTVLHSYLSSLLTEHPGYKVALSNRVFMSKELYPNPQYVSSLRKYYYADIEKVDFSTPDYTANQINKWIREITHGLIPNLLEAGSIRHDAQAVLTNAIYFKGKWKTQFDTQGTTPRCFYSSPGYCRNANMMETLGEYGYGYVKRLDAYALELPYQGNKFSMVVVMPNAVDGITQLVRDVLHVPLLDIVNLLQSNDVLVSIPRFTVDFSTDLISSLRIMGIKDIFGSSSNLTGLFSGGGMGQISNVFHKAKIVVNEEGSEAAAGTGAQVIPLMGSTILKFRADRPFLFFIRDVTTGVVLFSGRVIEPEFTKKENPQENFQHNIEEVFTSPPRPVTTRRPPRPNHNRRTTTVQSTTTQGTDIISTYSGFDNQPKPIYNNNPQVPSYAQAVANPQNQPNSQNSNSQNSPNSNSQQSQNTNIQPNQQQYYPNSPSSSSQQNTNGENISQQAPSRPSNTDSSQIHFPDGTDSSPYSGTQTNQNAGNQNNGNQFTSTPNAAIPNPLSVPETPQYPSRQSVATKNAAYVPSRTPQRQYSSNVQTQHAQNSNVQTASQRRDNEYVNNQNTRRVNSDLDTRTSYAQSTQQPSASNTRTIVTSELAQSQSYPYVRNDQYLTISNQPLQASGVPSWQNFRANQQQQPEVPTEFRNYQVPLNRANGGTDYTRQQY